MKEWNSYLKERLTTEEKLAIDLYAQDLDPERRDFFEAMDVHSQLKVSLVRLLGTYLPVRGQRSTREIL